MALRSTEVDTSNLPVPGLNSFWQEAEKQRTFIRLGTVTAIIRSGRVSSPLDIGI